jgi:hypothetical protein
MFSDSFVIPLYLPGCAEESNGDLQENSSCRSSIIRLGSSRNGQVYAGILYRNFLFLIFIPTFVNICYPFILFSHSLTVYPCFFLRSIPALLHFHFHHWYRRSVFNPLKKLIALFDINGRNLASLHKTLCCTFHFGR